MNRSVQIKLFIDEAVTAILVVLYFRYIYAKLADQNRSLKTAYAKVQSPYLQSTTGTKLSEYSLKVLQGRSPSRWEVKEINQQIQKQTNNKQVRLQWEKLQTISTAFQKEDSLKSTPFINTYQSLMKRINQLSVFKLNSVNSPDELLRHKGTSLKIYFLSVGGVIIFCLYDYVIESSQRLTRWAKIKHLMPSTPSISRITGKDLKMLRILFNSENGTKNYTKQPRNLLNSVRFKIGIMQLNICNLSIANQKSSLLLR